MLSRFDEDDVDASRRAFCRQTCSAIATIGMAAVFEACGRSPTSPSSAAGLPIVNGSLSNRTVTVTVDSASALAAVGSMALVRANEEEFLVSRSAQETFIVLTATCTHENCAITGHDNQVFVCPCHGSRFSSTGAVVQGPASRALLRFTAQFADPVLTFTV
jgi:Rieske Fe-S protein